MRKPPYLILGDTIGLTCTARSITLEELQPAIQLIESWGFKVKIGSSIGLVDHQYGGSDQERANSLQELLDDTEVKAILACRGGYGTVRIMDLLDFTVFKSSPKWIIGFSDITVLHSYANCQLGISSLHASMPSVFKTNTKESLGSIKNALLGQTLEYTFLTHSFNRNGIAKGEIVGGNLSLIYSMIGTKTDIDTSNRILFIEDLDEYVYHIDRMMISLKRAGKLDNLKAIIIGGMSDMNDNDTPFGKTAEEIIAEHVSEYNYPVCFGFPAGHISDNRSVVLGSQVILEVKADEVVFTQD